MYAHIKLLRKIGPEKLYGGLTNFGIGKKQATLSFPGEVSGRLLFGKVGKPISFLQTLLLDKA